MNLSHDEARLAKRLLDFASGLTYGLDGGLQKVSDKVFMLTPAQRRGLRRRPPSAARHTGCSRTSERGASR